MGLLVPEEVGQDHVRRARAHHHGAAVRRLYPEAFALANDQEQPQSRVFEMCRRIVLASPLLRADAQITQYKIAFPSFNATIQAIASDAGSAAGSNPTISCFDELWAYTSERSRRLWDEMNVPPTRKIPRG